MYGPLTQSALDELTQAAKDYKVDGAIYWAFIGCRHTCATIKLVKDLLNEIDIPMLTWIVTWLIRLSVPKKR